MICSVHDSGEPLARRLVVAGAVTLGSGSVIVLEEETRYRGRLPAGPDFGSLQKHLWTDAETNDANSKSKPVKIFQRIPDSRA